MTKKESPISRVRKRQATFFIPCDEERKIRTFFDNCNNRRKMQWGKTANENIEWTNKVVKWRMSDKCAKTDEGSRCMENHERLRERAVFGIDCYIPQIKVRTKGKTCISFIDIFLN